MGRESIVGEMIGNFFFDKKLVDTFVMRSNWNIDQQKNMLFKIQEALLNWITLGLNISYPNKQMIQLNKFLFQLTSQFSS